tara:strand:+ start:4146 stop:4868 length:723 start_codon:yes stop_codon:yes gene_type:complete
VIIKYPALTDADLRLKQSFDYCGRSSEFDVRRTATYRKEYKAWIHRHRTPDMIMHLSFGKVTKSGPGYKTLLKFLRAYARRTKQHLFIVAAWDYQPMRKSESVHFHILIWFEHQLPMVASDQHRLEFDKIDSAEIALRCWEQEWYAYTGGTAVIDKYDPDRNGASYAWDHHDEGNGAEFICGRNRRSCNRKPDRICRHMKDGIESQVIANWKPQAIKNPTHHFVPLPANQRKLHQHYKGT